jgi:hypothetical protein
MKTKIFQIKIHLRMHRKFAAIQENHQNSILFHESIPVKEQVERKKCDKALVRLQLLAVLSLGLIQALIT